MDKNKIRLEALKDIRNMVSDRLEFTKSTLKSMDEAVLNTSYYEGRVDAYEAVLKDLQEKIVPLELILEDKYGF